MDLCYDIQWIILNLRERMGADGMKKRWWKVTVCTALVLLLAGCLFRSPDDLYKQPEKSAGYEQLNQTISAVKVGLESEFGASVENAVIVSGDNTATIQLQDLDGDGERESALAFVRIPSVEKSIKIYVFRQMSENYFQIVGLIEGDATALYSIDYVDLNGSGFKEVVVNWQVSTGVYQLGAYTLDELLPTFRWKNENLPMVLQVPNQEQRSELLATQILSTSWTGAVDGTSGCCLLDVDQDTRTEVAVVRVDSAGVSSHVEVYGWQDGSMNSLGVVGLSSGITSLQKLRANYVGGELYPPALYVISGLQDGRRVIDILTYQEGALNNLTLDEETGVSQEIAPNIGDIGLTDINGDMVLEIPVPRPLPAYNETVSGNYWLTDWMQYDEAGESTRVLTTYHNTLDGWYLIIPDSWNNKILITRNDQVIGQKEVLFSYWLGGEDTPVPFLSIYRFTGTNRAAASTRYNRFVLYDEGSVIYSAKLYDSKWNCGIDQTGLIDYFNIIQNSWLSN